MITLIHCETCKTPYTCLRHGTCFQANSAHSEKTINEVIAMEKFSKQVAKDAAFALSYPTYEEARLALDRTFDDLEPIKQPGPLENDDERT